MSALVSSDVLVGVPAQSTDRDGGPINNATLAYIHENGSPKANIPARPFLVPGVKSVQDKVTSRLKKAADAALDGKPKLIDQQLHAAGLIAESSVKNTINAGIDPALADSTIAARNRRGRTGTVPLIDTGKLRNSITHVIRKK
ncbi:MAG: hypothetical protein KGL90_15460 [Burkholderiales bacterium]|nr:hypothetical protein [Burkholderiales bacterium]